MHYRVEVLKSRFGVLQTLSHRDSSCVDWVEALRLRSLTPSIPNAELLS